MGMGGGTGGGYLQLKDIRKMPKKEKSLLLNIAETLKQKDIVVGDLSVRVVNNLRDLTQYETAKFSCLDGDLNWSLHIDYNKNKTKPLIVPGLTYEMLRGIIYTNAKSANASTIVYVAPYQESDNKLTKRGVN